jgi:hypothetical protein
VGHTARLNTWEEIKNPFHMKCINFLAFPPMTQSLYQVCYPSCQFQWSRDKYQKHFKCNFSEEHITRSRQQCHNSKLVIFQEKLLKVLKCCNFLWVQWRHNCSPAASFTNCVMTLYVLKAHLQTFLSIPVTQKCQILSCDAIVANERYNSLLKLYLKIRERKNLQPS